MLLKTVVFSALLAVGWCEDLDFPVGFKFGAATAAYQVEGGWNASGLPQPEIDLPSLTHQSPMGHQHPSDLHEPSKVVRPSREGSSNSSLDGIVDRSNGDVACDSYHLWKEDVALMKDLGLQFYRFSISWSRLLPSGFSNHVSEAGSQYYSQLIDELLRNGIEPVVTLYHWDLPQRLQNLGGWTNPLIVDWFGDYASIVYSLYADRVKTWITLNEPVTFCDVGYSGIHAPAIIDTDVGVHLCTKNVLLAHARAWRMYDEQYRAVYHGRVSVSMHIMWYEPQSPGDEKVASNLVQYFNGRYLHPIYSKEGGWPELVEKVIAENSRKEGFPRSRLPAFTEEEKQYIRGTYDFMALNHYTTMLGHEASEGDSVGPWPFSGAPELHADIIYNTAWPQGASFWFRVYPEGLRRALVWIKEQYGDIEIFITENGFATKGGLEDDDRIHYFAEYLKQILLAIKEDKVNVTGYTAWSLLDNFEWSEGYTSKFGLYEVDFSSPKRTRTPRKSAKFYKHLIKHHSLEFYSKYEAKMHEAFSRTNLAISQYALNVSNILLYLICTMMYQLCL